MGLEGVGVFSIYSGFLSWFFSAPKFNGGITTIQDEGFGLIDADADGGLGMISVLPEFFGVSLNCFNDITLLLDCLPLLLILRLELLAEEVPLFSSFAIFTEDIFD